MNKYPTLLTEQDWLELTKRPGFKGTTGKCPTCRDRDTYTWKGKALHCEKDYDGICIQYKLFQRYELANLPLKYQRLNWNDFNLQPEAKDTVDDYLEHKENAILNGVGLYIYSTGLGTGKTFIGTHILKEFLKAGYKGYYVPFFDILDLYRREEDERRFIESKLLDAPLLVIDDVVEGKVSDKQAEYYRMTLERVVRHRAHNSWPTIVTSNLALNELQSSYERIFSLASDSMLPLELDSTIDTRIRNGLTRNARAMLSGETPPIT